MSQPHPFPKLPPWDTAKLMPRRLWSARKTAVFLLAYSGAFAAGFWLACWVRGWLW